MRLNVDDAVRCLTSEKVCGRMNERGRRTWLEPGGSADPSISDSVRLELDDLLVRLPHIQCLFYVQ